MRAKPAVLRRAADNDIDAALTRHALTAGRQVARELNEAIRAAIRHIERHPGTGSPRYSHELQIEGLRTWPVRRFPYLIVYVERPDGIDVWRVLHGARDIAGTIRDPDQT